MKIKMLSISKNNIPEYLHSSNFYNNLDDENDYIDIPKTCFKEDETINNFKDFKRLFHVYKYFGCDFSQSFERYYILHSDEVFKYFSKMSKEIEVRDMLVKFSEYKIENIRQFITTYKIMKIYDLIESEDFYGYYLENKYEIVSRCIRYDELEKNLAYEIKEYSYVSISYDTNLLSTKHYMSILYDTNLLSTKYSIGVTLRKGLSSIGGWFEFEKDEIFTEIDKLKELRSHIFNKKNTKYICKYLSYENRSITMNIENYDVKINFFNRIHICSIITDFMLNLKNMKNNK